MFDEAQGFWNSMSKEERLKTLGIVMTVVQIIFSLTNRKVSKRRQIKIIDQRLIERGLISDG